MIIFMFTYWISLQIQSKFLMDQILQWIKTLQQSYHYRFMMLSLDRPDAQNNSHFNEVKILSFDVSLTKLVLVINNPSFYFPSRGFL